jgi:molecular chaperone DnaK
MVNEARANEAEDKKRRELIEAKNNADNLVYQTEKALRDLGEKVPSAERGAIESKVNDLKTAAQTDDVNRIRKATDDVQNAFHALSQQLYAQGAQGQPQPETGGRSTPPSGKDEGDVIEGEVKE